MRLAVGLSGGADSVALVRALAARCGELGLVLHAAHLHHGLRGAEADADLEFCRTLAGDLGLPFHEARVDTTAEARANPATGKSAETLEEAARRLRYSWFRELLSKIPLDAIATAHTLDDQAETVLAKLLRGAWTEGLGGISPTLQFPEGLILRPLLETTRAEVEAYLNAIGQPWREDSTNKHLSFTRNRIRHELLPLLEGWNPNLRQHLAQMATLARDEDAWWQAELARLTPELILPGKPVRGGGRAAAGGLSIDAKRFAALTPALQRRLVRQAAAQLGARPDFPSTETLRTLALAGRAGQKCEIEGLHAERTPRELRLEPGPAAHSTESATTYEIPVPGEVDAPAFGLRVRIETAGPACKRPASAVPATGSASAAPTARLRNWAPGDRVRLRHSSSSRKVKEILERLRVTGSERAFWPVLELAGRILWMRGVELEPDPDMAPKVTVHVQPLEEESATDCHHLSSIQE
jgi:tRNA(Ile)-lysidine synthase